MRLNAITFVVLACVWLTTGDITHLKAAKTRLLGRLASKHHKRGIYSAVPPFKLGHDIPLVTHSVVKPIVVTYPPTASVAAVKVPVTPPFPRFPTSVSHKGHPHFGLKSPHHKTVLVPKPDQHFHHHHHHVEPKPIVPLLPAPPVVPATPLVPVPQPAGTAVHPSPPVIVHSSPVQPAQPLPVAPPPIPLLPQPVPLKPLVPLTPIQPAQAVNVPTFPLAPQFSYIIRPGSAVQTSFFATYPRYPLVNYQSPSIPLATPPTPLLPSGFYNRPQYHQLAPPVGVHGFYDQQIPSVGVEQSPALLHPTQNVIPHNTLHLNSDQYASHLHPAEPSLNQHPAQPTLNIPPAELSFHLQPAQPTLHVQATQPTVPLDHDGWSPVPTQHDLGPAQPETHYQQPLDSHHFTQEQGTQIYENHTGNEQFHDYQNQLQHHIQHQIDQAQYEQHLNQQHLLNQEQANQEFQQNQEYAQRAHEYAQHIQEYAQHAQDYAQTNEHHLQQEHGYQAGQEYHQPEQEYGQPTQEYNQPGQAYGAPQGIEGRSGESEGDAQKYHNHIPLGLQPPIDRPLEHFR